MFLTLTVPDDRGRKDTHMAATVMVAIAIHTTLRLEADGTFLVNERDSSWEESTASVFRIICVLIL